jgi:hypothetical protein
MIGGMIMTWKICPRCKEEQVYASTACSGLCETCKRKKHTMPAQSEEK